MDSFATSSRQTGMPVEFEDDDVAAEGDEGPAHENAELLAQLQQWLTHERDRQAENRYQMALDAEYYDGNQWLEDDARAVEARGQAPLTFNEIAVSINWIIGSEKRNRVDWRVLPRTPDDAPGAEVKTAVMKYISDVNNVPFVRSASFAEAAICGLSWIEDSLSDDATADILYSGHQSWRSAYHDSYHTRLDFRDGRYFFRWKVLDLDVAEAMFPGKEAALKRAARGSQLIDADEDDELWYLGTPLSDKNKSTFGRRTYLASTVQAAFSQRERVKVWECWYRKPMEAEVIRGGAFDGELYDPENANQNASIDEGNAYVQKSVVMRVHRAMFVDDEIIDASVSPFKHNDIPFTPVYCFRRQRDGMPYGFVRNMRDPQDDLNKRMSKSLFILSVNQLITEKGAFDENGEYTLQDAIDNVANPAGVFVLADGNKRFEIRRDYAEEQQQMLHVTMDRQFLQSASGVTDELLGRKTNATSGRAIEARQDQGSLATNGIFDNYRLAIRLSGQKQLSNAERFYSMPKVIRLTERKDVQWVPINQPEIQADGTVRFHNDITATKADFIVDEQDYRSTMRQAMFESLNEMIGKVMQVAPQFGISLLDLLVDLADFPGKEEMVGRVKQLIAEHRGETKTPDQAAAEAEAMELEKQAAAAKIAKDEAAANKADAEADQIRMTLPAQAVAMDLQNVAQAQAVTGQTPMQPAEIASQTGKPAMDGTAASSMPAEQGVPDPMSLVAEAVARLTMDSEETKVQVSSAMQSMAATLEQVASSVEQVAAVATAAQDVAMKSAAASQVAAASAEVMAGAIERVSRVAEEAKKSTARIDKTLAELRKPREKVVEFTNAQGQKVRATIKG